MEFDAINLAETLTDEFVWPMARWNFPGIDWRPKLEIIVEDSDPESLLKAAKIFQDMGGNLGEDQVREIIGLSAPDKTDRILKPPSEQTSQRSLDKMGPQGGWQPWMGNLPGGGQGPGQDEDDDEPPMGGSEPPDDDDGEEYYGPKKFALQWDELKHPRDDDGKFGEGGGGGGAKVEDKGKGFRLRGGGGRQRSLFDPRDETEQDSEPEPELEPETEPEEDDVNDLKVRLGWITKDRTIDVGERIEAYGKIYEEDWQKIQSFATEREEKREGLEAELEKRREDVRKAWDEKFYAQNGAKSREHAIRSHWDDHYSRLHDMINLDDIEDPDERQKRKESLREQVDTERDKDIAKEYPGWLARIDEAELAATEAVIARDDMLRQIDELDSGGEERAKIHEMLASRVPEEKRISSEPIYNNKASKAIKEKVNEALAFFEGTMATRTFVNKRAGKFPGGKKFYGMHGGHRSEKFTPKVNASTSRRVKYVSGFGIFSNSKDKADIVVHELGHMLEDIPAIKDAENEFLEMRTNSNENVSMKKQFPDYRYGSHEIGNKDDFGKVWGDNDHEAYYVGKRYEDRSTEVVSMGLQMMFKDPARLAKDRQYFDFISAVMDGTVGGNPGEHSPRGETNPWGRTADQEAYSKISDTMMEGNVTGEEFKQVVRKFGIHGEQIPDIMGNISTQEADMIVDEIKRLKGLGFK